MLSARNFLPSVPHASRQARRRARTALAAVLSLLIVTAELGAVPRRGIHVPELKMLDDLVADFMDANGIGAGLFGIMKDGVVVLHRSYGWKDIARTEALEPDAILRIASVTKPITAAAIRHLIDETDLELDTPVFDLGNNGGVLQMTPFPSLGDGRLKNVTIEHCLQHRGGWDRNQAGDLTYQEIAIAGAMGVPSPPSRWDTARYVLGQPLQFTPGSKSSYSNVGYMLLGLVIEEKSGESYLDYIRRKIFRPLGVKDCEVVLGRTFEADKDPREPWYDSWLIAPNVYQPWMPVSMPYGGWNHEARLSQGRIVTGPAALLRFMDEYVVGGGDIGETLGEDGVWRWHGGILEGTSAAARQRGDLSYVVIFNKSGYADQVKDLIDSYLASKTFDWPTTSREYVSAVCGSEPFVRGDCDGNGEIDASDVYLLSLSLARRRSLPCRAAADVNGDSRIDYADVTHLSSFVHRQGAAPVAPFPGCGVGRQPKDDALGCAEPPGRCR